MRVDEDGTFHRLRGPGKDVPTNEPDSINPVSFGPRKLCRLSSKGKGTFLKALDAKIGMYGAIARQILQQDTRIKLKPEELWQMELGEGEPLDLMRKYYGKSMRNLDARLDDFLPRTNLPPRDLATRVLAEVELIPQFARGGLARILEL